MRKEILWSIYAQLRDQDRDWEWNREQWVLIYDAEMFTLLRDWDMDQDPLFPIV